MTDAEKQSLKGCAEAWLARIGVIPEFDTDTLAKGVLSLLADQEGRGWRPIATAPKGERILIGGGQCPRVQENELRCFKTAGCTFSGLGDRQQPSHWMPLPPKPVE